MQRADRRAVDVQRHAEQRRRRSPSGWPSRRPLRRRPGRRASRTSAAKPLLRQPPRPRACIAPGTPSAIWCTAAVPSSACSRIAARSTPSTSDMRTSSSLISSSNASEPSAASVMRWTAARRWVSCSACARLARACSRAPRARPRPARGRAGRAPDDQRRILAAVARDRGEAAGAGDPLVRHAEEHAAPSRSRPASPPPAPRAAPVVAADVLGHERVEPARAGRPPGGPSSAPSARLACGDAPARVQARHPDRRVLEDRAPQPLALAQRPRRLVQLEEHADLRAQHLGVIRLEQVVDGAGRVALVDVRRLGRDRGHEDDRDARVRSRALISRAVSNPSSPASGRRAGSPRSRPAAAP